MEEKKTVTLDLTGCHYLLELHRRIKEAFDFPDFYGENWSAFWDLLRSECDANRIVVIGVKSLPQNLKESGGKILEILQRHKIHAKELFDEDVEIELVDDI